MRAWTLITRDGAELVSGVEAFDEGDAALKLLEAAGIEVVPCCHVEDDPCARCAEAAYERHQEALLECPPVKPSPEQIWAGDADRSTLPDTNAFGAQGVAPALWPKP